MRKLNNAFTLTELMVALGVIAILCALLLPVIFNLMPNQNTIMAKRAFYATQSIISDLINDETCYPDKTTAASTAAQRVGFDDEYGYTNCKKYNSNSQIETGGSASDKFQILFLDKLGLPTDTLNSEFTTSDGMVWKFSSIAFNSADDEGGSLRLTVDVNGTSADKGKPNCGNGTAYNAVLGSGTDGNCTADKRTTGFDRFQMIIYGNGKIEIVDDWAREAVKVHKNLTDE